MSCAGSKYVFAKRCQGELRSMSTVWARCHESYNCSTRSTDAVSIAYFPSFVNKRTTIIGLLQLVWHGISELNNSLLHAAGTCCPAVFSAIWLTLQNRPALCIGH